ncbi:MAG: hypothetical protein IK121_05710, partial [Lachnospiraceae bacterium]|nr:hypothetical protein [Lachnospiraceae bacterium]
DERTDIYGIGVTLFNLLTDVDPKSFKGNVFSIRTIFPELSSGLDRIIIKCTERDPDNRYQTMGELKKALLNYSKYDVQYVIKKKKLLRKFYTYLGIGVVSLLIALGLGITNKIINSNSYDELIAGTPTIAEIEKAISIKPNDERAFSLMLDSFGEEITRDEMSLFSRNYSKAKTQMGKDVLVEVSMKAGERILSSYEEESDRAKLITSYPYFEEVKNNASKSYEKYDAALIYCNMTEFYKDYIMQNNAMIIKEPDKAAHEELLNEIKTSIEIADSYEGQEAKSLVLSLYSISLSLIENESNACYEEGIEEEALTSIVEDIKERTNKISSELTVMKERKEKVLKLCESTEKKIESAYGKHKEER